MEPLGQALLGFLVSRVLESLGPCWYKLSLGWSEAAPLTPLPSARTSGAPDVRSLLRTRFRADFAKVLGCLQVVFAFAAVPRSLDF